MSTTDGVLADRMYPSSTSSTADALADRGLSQTPKVTQNPNARADRMYPSTAATAANPSTVPAAILDMRRADPARRMFDANKAFAQALPDGSLDGYDHAEARQIAADVGASHDDLSMLRSLHAASANAGDDVRGGWHAESLDRMRRNDFNDADLDHARAFVARDPRVFAYLDRTGLGSHPDVVERFVALGRAAKLAGKF